MLCSVTTYGIEPDFDGRLCDRHEVEAKKGQAFSQYYLGSCYQCGRGREQDVDKALFWYKASAAAGNKLALEGINNIWLFYKSNKNQAETAIKSLNVQLNDGYGRAGVILSVCYHNGVWVEQDNTKAVEFFKRAADLKVTQAMAGIYYVYKFGLLNQKPDQAKQRFWYDSLEAILSNEYPIKTDAATYLNDF
ncbi:MAG: tetratricopeptide repeat protein [bacterium]